MDQISTLISLYSITRGQRLILKYPSFWNISLGRGYAQVFSFIRFQEFKSKSGFFNDLKLIELVWRMKSLHHVLVASAYIGFEHWNHKIKDKHSSFLAFLCQYYAVEDQIDCQWSVLKPVRVSMADQTSVATKFGNRTNTEYLVSNSKLIRFDLCSQV